MPIWLRLKFVEGPLARTSKAFRSGIHSGDSSDNGDARSTFFAPEVLSKSSNEEKELASGWNLATTRDLPSGDQVGPPICALSVASSFSSEPSALAIITSPSPSWNFLRTKAICERSGEKVILELILCTTRSALPPRTGARYRLLRFFSAFSARTK